MPQGQGGHGARAQSQPCLPPAAALGLWPHSPSHSSTAGAVPGTSSGPASPWKAFSAAHLCCRVISLQIGAVGGCEKAGTCSSEHGGATWPLPAAASWGWGCPSPTPGSQLCSFLQGETPRGNQVHFGCTLCPWIDTPRDWECRVWRRGTRRRSKAKPAADLSSARKTWR